MPLPKNGTLITPHWKQMKYFIIKFYVHPLSFFFPLLIHSNMKIVKTSPPIRNKLQFSIARFILCCMARLIVICSYPGIIYLFVVFRRWKWKNRCQRRGQILRSKSIHILTSFKPSTTVSKQHRGRKIWQSSQH